MVTQSLNRIEPRSAQSGIDSDKIHKNREHDRGRDERELQQKREPGVPPWFGMKIFLPKLMMRPTAELRAIPINLPMSPGQMLHRILLLQAPIAFINADFRHSREYRHDHSDNENDRGTKIEFEPLIAWTVWQRTCP